MLMKRAILYYGFSLLILFTVSSQNLTILSGSVPIANGDTYTIAGDTSGTVYSYLNCTNQGVDTIAVKVKKKIINKVFGSDNTFCWVNCYTPDVMVSTAYIKIAPGATASDFIGEYQAHGNIGITTILYTFYDKDNEADSSSVSVKYDCSLSSIDKKLPEEKITLSNAYPNPADNFVSFSYDIPFNSVNNSKLIIRDLVGNTVYETNFFNQQGVVKIECNDFSNGVYFYSFLIHDQPLITRKLVIKH